MKFYVKDLEQLEEKENWANLLAEMRIQFRSLSDEIANAYKIAGLDDSQWLAIGSSIKEIDKVFKAEFDPEWVEKLVPNIEKGIVQLENSKKDIPCKDYLIESLKKILKIAKTCGKYKKGMVIAI